MRNSFFKDPTINDSIKSHIETRLLKYKNIKYAYAIMSKSNPTNFTIISNRQEWFKVYQEHNFQFIDPVLVTALDRITPFSWDENIMLNQGIKVPKVFDMAKNHNIVNGYTFILHDQYNNLIVLSLMMDETCDDNIYDSISEDIDSLQMMLISTHEKLTTSYKEKEKIANFKKMNSGEILSNRENEIIYWASVGKSYQEISLILGIKMTTVKYHIGNVVRKMGVTNAKHAIRMGVELQLIRPILSDG